MTLTQLANKQNNFHIDLISTYFKFFLVGSTYINPQIFYTNIHRKALFFNFSGGLIDPTKLYLALPLGFGRFGVGYGLSLGLYVKKKIIIFFFNKMPCKIKRKM